MKNSNKTDLFIEEYDAHFSYQTKKTNLNISFNRIAFIFFVFVIVSLIFSTKAVFLGSLKKKITNKNLIESEFRSSIVDRNGNIIAKTINNIDKNIIFLVPTGSKMEIAAKKLNMKIACEIFADRNYEDDGNLVSRSKNHALITDPEVAKKHVLSMVKNQALNCYSGKQISCEIDSVCIHGDNQSSLATAKSIKENLLFDGLILKPLSKMRKFN